MALGALVFAVGHPKPFGPIGMGLFLAGRNAFGTASA